MSLLSLILKYFSIAIRFSKDSKAIMFRVNILIAIASVIVLYGDAFQVPTKLVKIDSHKCISQSDAIEVLTCEASLSSVMLHGTQLNRWCM